MVLFTKYGKDPPAVAPTEQPVELKLVKTLTAGGSARTK